MIEYSLSRKAEDFLRFAQFLEVGEEEVFRSVSVFEVTALY